MAECSFLKENDDMAWTLLVVAGFFEIVWATLLKFTDGFTRVWPSYRHRRGDGYQYGLYVVRVACHTDGNGLWGRE